MTDGEYRILFMVKARYFDAIVAGTKTFELRAYTNRWQSVALRANQTIRNGGRVMAVFQCGRRIHRRQVLSGDAGLVQQALGRLPTTEETEMLGGDDPKRVCAYSFQLGEVVP